MKSKLIEVLKTLGYVEGKTIFLQGTLSPDEPYPNEFITFWTDNTADNAHFDNKTKSVDWWFNVILYSDDPETVNTKPNKIISALKKAGFIPQGKGQDIPSDEPTHTGWQMDFIYTEYLF